MASYKVKALTISGAGKQIFRAGNVISDKDLVQGAGSKYVKTGHLELIKAPKAEPKKADPKPEAKAEVKVEAKAEPKKENPVNNPKKGKKK